MKPPAKTHTRGIHAALRKKVGHFRTTWLILAVLTLTIAKNMVVFCGNTPNYRGNLNCLHQLVSLLEAAASPPSPH